MTDTFAENLDLRAEPVVIHPINWACGRSAGYVNCQVAHAEAFVIYDAGNQMPGSYQTLAEAISAIIHMMRPILIWVPAETDDLRKAHAARLAAAEGRAAIDPAWFAGND